MNFNVANASNQGISNSAGSITLSTPGSYVINFDVYFTKSSTDTSIYVGVYNQTASPATFDDQVVLHMTDSLQYFSGCLVFRSTVPNTVMQLRCYAANSFNVQLLANPALPGTIVGASPASHILIQEALNAVNF